jgi:Protein of unknown function (DUF1064)
MPPRNKFGAKITTVDGIRFDSIKEAARWQELRLLERAGEIRNLRRQIVIPLQGVNGPLKTKTGRAMKLTVDFGYQDKRLDWAEVLEDSKGMRTRDFDVRIAVAEAMGLKVVLS